MTWTQAAKQALVLATGDKETLKKLGIAVLVIIVTILMPIAAILAVFSGKIEIDPDRLTEMVMDNISEEKRAELDSMNGTMTAIRQAMTEAGFKSRTQEAQVLYVLALSDFSSEPDFAAALASCFDENQTDNQLIDNINDRFGTDLSKPGYHYILERVRAVSIDTSGFIAPHTKNSADLAAWAVSAEKQGWGYVWGTYGGIMNKSVLKAKTEQYPSEVGEQAEFIEEDWLGKRTADCVGLIKGYGWYDPDADSFVYYSNGMPDASADQMYDNATEKGTINTMPDVPGLAVWRPGHIGIYIGNGEVIEAYSTKSGVKKTVLAERDFTHWLRIPYISYDTPAPETEEIISAAPAENGGQTN